MDRYPRTMVGEELLSKRVNRGLLMKGWAPRVYDLAKSFLLPSFLPASSRKPMSFLPASSRKPLARTLRDDLGMFQRGITSTIVGFHVNMTKVIPAEVLQDVPVGLPWKVLQKVSIPCVADLLRLGPAPLASGTHLVLPRPVEDIPVNPSTRPGYTVGHQDSFPAARNRILEYRLEVPRPPNAEPGLSVGVQCCRPPLLSTSTQTCTPVTMSTSTHVEDQSDDDRHLAGDIVTMVRHYVSLKVGPRPDDGRVDKEVTCFLSKLEDMFGDKTRPDISNLDTGDQQPMVHVQKSRTDVHGAMTPTDDEHILRDAVITMMSQTQPQSSRSPLGTQPKSACRGTFIPVVPMLNRPVSAAAGRGTFDVEPMPEKPVSAAAGRGTVDVAPKQDESAATGRQSSRSPLGTKPKSACRGTFIPVVPMLNRPVSAAAGRGTFDVAPKQDESAATGRPKGTYELPAMPDHPGKSGRKAGNWLTSYRDTFSPLTEVEGAAKALTTVPTYEDEHGWTVPEMDVPLVAEECIEWKLGPDGITHVILGTGTFGSVELARYQLLDGSAVDVAVKVYKDQASFDTITREAKMLQYLQDTGVFPYFYGYMDIGVGDVTNVCLVQECFGNGRTLADFVDTDASYHFEPREWLSVCMQLAKGLNKIHEKLVRFNDLKENNILVDDSVSGRPVVKFIDVGISTYNHGVFFSYTEEELTKYPGCFAPELVEGKPTTVLTDIYSLGQIFLVINDKTTIPGLLNLAQSCARPFPQHRIAIGGVITSLVSIARHREMR